MLSKLLCNCDFFAAPPTLRARSQPETTNICGGILSIVIFIVFFILFIINSINIFTLSDISVTTRDEQFDDGKGEISDIMFAVGFRLFKAADLAPLVTISAYLVKTTSESTEYIAVQLQPCELEQWEALGQNAQTKYDEFQLSKKFCPVPNQNLTIKNTYFNSNFDFLSVVMSQCQNLPHCAENETEAIENFLNIFRYFQTTLFVLDTGFNPSKEHSTFHKITNIRSTFTLQRSTQVAIDISKYQVETDVSLSPFVVLEQEQGHFVNEKFQGYYETRKYHPYLSYNFFFSEEYKVIERKYGKVDEVLSYVGGLFALVLSFFSFFMMSYNQYRYEIMVAEGAFNYNDEGKKLLAQDLSFFKYMKYSIFAWIATFCCCQFQWEDCKEIEETRQEANNQLDVSLLFKKLQHFDRAIEYLITEREQLCLYLTEPPSIKEVKKKRKYAEYYDKIIKGQSAMTIEDVKVSQNLQNIFGYAINISVSDAKYRENTRIQDKAEKSRQNILEVALQKHSEEEQEIQLSQEEKQIEVNLAQCFFHMKPENRRRIQQKIPIRILQRLQQKLNQMNSEVVFEIDI